MIIVDPVALGDVACTRASPKWVYDRTGTLVQVPNHTLAVTYDSTDLTKAPYPVVELAAATNLALWAEDFSNSVWGSGRCTVTPNAVLAPDGTLVADLITAGVADSYLNQSIAGGAGGSTLTFSVWLRADAPLEIDIYLTDHGVSGNNRTFCYVTTTWQRFSVTRTAPAGVPNMEAQIGGGSSFATGAAVYAWGAQVEVGRSATSVIRTTSTVVTRAADVIDSGAGLVYSNVPIAEAAYSGTTTYAKDALVYDAASHVVYQSLVASNVGKALTDTTAWTPRGATNRWAMLDQYNNTQTSSADEIILVLAPQVVSRGLYLGNLLADEVRISVVDNVDGVVYQEMRSLIASNSGSSFFNWGFKRIRRQNFFLSLKLPAYANALVTICIRKIGGTAKCGMCAIGPVDEFGPTLAGLSMEGKDYSSTTFAFDGTSSTILRPYAKRIDCDVLVDNDQIDYLQDRLFEIRQKPVVWVGGSYSSTAAFGRYGSFKVIIKYTTRSEMNLTIEGAV